jgi:carbon storage regulator
MLVLTRKLMEKLFIGDNICVTVVRVEGGQVRLGVDAPRSVPVLRGELRGRAPSPRSSQATDNDPTIRAAAPTASPTARGSDSRSRERSR